MSRKLSTPNTAAAPSKRPRGRPRSKKAETAILDATYRLLAESGIQAVTIEAIAAEAKVSKATIYKWWPNRAAVLMSAFLRASQDAIPYPGALHPDDMRTRLQSMGEQFRGGVGQMMAALIAAGQSDPDFAQEFREGYIHSRRVDGVKLVRTAIKEGRIKNADPHTILDVIYAPLYYRLLIGHEELTDEFVSDYLDLVLNGILADSQLTESERGEPGQQ